MAVTYGFYNALNHDRLYDAIQMSSIFDGIIQDGIFSTIGTSMIVTAPEDGMFVDVGPGRAWFNHTWTLNDTEYPVEAEEAEVVLDRIDAVILEVNSAAEVRANSIKFLKGTPSSNPVKPTLTHNAEVNQYALAYVTIRAGQTTIFQSDIENVVGTDETPFVTGLLQQVSVERLLLQWNDDFYRYFANFKTVSEADLLTWFNSKKDEYDAWYADMEREGAEDLEEFDTWFQHMKDQLDEDAAGHLQAEVDELAEACEKGSVLTVTTEESALIGRTCTVSQGLDSINKQFDANGVAEFPSVPYVGNIDIRATNGDQIAQSVLNIPYFGRYGVEIAFWAATLDIHSSVSELYGRTVTISKGGSVVGTTSFDNTGHAVFKVHEPGTYHISTSTAGGDTYTADVVVTEETAYNIDMGLPNGETVLPTDDIQIWLHCAGINNKAYLQTLSDVLGEPDTYQALLSDMNACAYMARSTTWAGQSGTLVPNMTSATTPNGEVTQSSYYSGQDGYKAFNSNTSSGWIPAMSEDTGTPWVQYEFDEAQVVSKVSAFGGQYGSTPYTFTFKVQGSNDGSDFTDLATGLQYVANTSTTTEFDINNDTAYKFYRITLTNKTSTSWNINSGNRFGLFNEGITTDSQAMSLLGRYDYACEKLLANETWAEAIAGSEYYESVLDVKVPTMTSNTTPSGTVSASNNTSGNDAYKAFDKNTSTYWGASTTSNQWVQYAFTSAVKIKSVSIKALYATKARVKNFKIQGSNDGFVSDTHDLYTGVYPDDSTEPVLTCVLDNEVAYQTYRLLVVDTHTSNIAVKELNFYGRHASNLIRYNPEVPIMTSNTTPSGECSASSIFSTGANPAWRAFDGQTNTGWVAANGSTNGQWIAYQFPQNKKVDIIDITTNITGYSGTTTSGTITVKDSNDNVLGSGTISGGKCRIELEDANTDLYKLVYSDIPSGSASYATAAIIQFYTKSELPLIHSAPNDTVYYLDGSSPVTVCTTDANGIGEFDLEDLPKGSVTLYSTVAKDPNNLSNPYSKTVIVTGETTEIYLMPDGALYWWGWKNDDCEDMTSANGWSYSNYTMQTPTFGTNKITGSAPDRIVQGIGSKYKLSGNSLHAIVKGLSTGSNIYGTVGTLSNKNISNSIQHTNITSTILTHLQIQAFSDNYAALYVSGGSGGTRSFEANAFWYEL